MGTGFATARAPQRRLTPFAACVRELSERFVRAQRSLRVLQAIRWEAGIERDFFARGCRELPSVTLDYYRGRPLPFAAAPKLAELASIEHETRRLLGADSAPGAILLRLCREFRGVAHMLSC